METLGLIAGNRRLPFLFASQARARGFRIAALGFEEETDRRLAGAVDAFEIIPLGQLGRLLKFFKSNGVRRAVMQGQIQHRQLYAKLRPDWRAKWLLTKQALLVRDFRTEAILGAIARELGRHGIALQSATWLMEPYLAGKGVLGKVRPSRQALRDLDFGRKLCRGVGALDIGQTVCVKRQSCVAVESIEGTDACIRRAAKLAGPGMVVVKMARPSQDLRFDLPVVGPKTFEVLARARAAALGLEAGKTLMLEKEKCLKIAGESDLTVLAYEGHA